MSTPTPTANTTPDPCAFELQDYDQPLAIAAVFIILVASTLGAVFPLLGKRFPSAMPTPFFYLCGKHIGTGVLLALGLIHLLAPAVTALGSPCLSQNFLTYQYAPLFALLAAIGMHFIDMLVGLLLAPSPQRDLPEHYKLMDEHEHHQGHSHSLLIGSHVDRSIAAYILEFGLTSHSVIIGIAVGVTTHDALKTLIPALSFHQFFEGFALGARVAEVGFSGFIEILLTVIYCTSAPIGIAIGIGIHQSYNPNSATANYVQGTFDAIAAGIILYVAFVQMLAIDFPRDLNSAAGCWRKALLFVCLWTGAGIMAFLGKYL